MYNFSLYETKSINVLAGWVPIPTTNEVIQKKNNKIKYGKVSKITDKNFKNGFKSGMRIIKMKKGEFELKPIPSYIKIEGCELYVTYSGEYCGNKGHVQSNCQKDHEIFPT